MSAAADGSAREAFAHMSYSHRCCSGCVPDKNAFSSLPSWVAGGDSADDQDAAADDDVSYR